MTINVSDIEAYFKFLSTHKNPENEIFTYCLLDKESKAVIPGHGVKFGILKEILELLHSDSLRGLKYTLHTTLNSTKLTGRKTKDIEAVRVLCVDFDREVPKNSLKPLVKANAVQMVVESSPGKYHFYWKIDPAIPLGIWHTYQLGLNQFFGGDTQLAGISHTIRVPGVSRVTKEGKDFLPAIVYIAEDTPVLGQARILEMFPWMLDKAEEASTAQKKKRQVVRNTIKKSHKSGKPDFSNAVKEEDRNSTLFSLIFGLTADIGGAALELEQAQIIGEDYNQSLHLHAHPKGMMPEDELQKTVESAFERGLIAREKRQAREEKKLARLLGVDDFSSPIKSPIVTELIIHGKEPMHTNGHVAQPVKMEEPNSRQEYTDYDNTERIIAKFYTHLIRNLGIVYAFNRQEMCWEPQKYSTAVMQSYVTECTKAFVREEAFINTCKGEDGEVSIAKYERMKGRLQGNTVLAQTINACLNSLSIQNRPGHIFDLKFYLFYAGNGVIDLERIGTNIRPAVAEDYLTRRSNVAFDSSAGCPYWIKFLSEIFENNEEPEAMISFLQEVFGYSLTGDISEQVIFLHSGEGSNGKSRVLYALQRLMGEYSERLDSTALTKSKGTIGKEVERIGAKIEGKRVVIIDDLDTKTQWNDGLVKSLTDKTIVCRKLYQEARDIPNRAKFHIACNETPGLEGNSFSMLRRILIIEYNRRFEPDSEKLNEIDGAIDRELSGILNWAITGLRRLKARGKLFRPDEVVTRLEDYKEANLGADAIIPEIFERTEDPTAWHTIAECVQHANRMATVMGHVGAVFKPESLGRELVKLGFKHERRRAKGPKQRGYLAHLVDTKIKHGVEIL